MRKRTSPSVRFEAEQKERIQQAARSLRIKPADVIRLAVDQFLDDIDRHGRLVVPVRNSERAVAEDKQDYRKEGSSAEDKSS